MSIANVLDAVNVKPLSPALKYLTNFNQFVLWNSVPDSEAAKPRKISCDYRTGRWANAHNPEVWGNYDLVAGSAARFGNDYYSGFTLTRETKIALFDFDNARQADGTWHPVVYKIISRLPGAAVEVSHSGNGLHAWCLYQGELDADDITSVTIEGLDVELFLSKKFIALGNQDTATGDISTDCTNAVIELIAEYFPKKVVKDAVYREVPPATADDQRHARYNFQKLADNFANSDPDSPGHKRLLAAGRTAGGYIASGCFDLEFAEEIMYAACAVWYVARRGWHDITKTFNDGIRDGYNLPILPGQDPNDVGFGKAPLPEGASLVPLPAQGSLTMSPEEQVLANLATQHSVALLFAKRANGKMLYDHSRKAWMEYDGTRWKVDERKKVHNFILNLASEANKQNKASMVTSQFCNGVNTHLQSFPEFSRTSKDFDQDHYLLNTPSGTLDLRTGKMRPHDPADMITLCTAAAPDAESDGTAFRKFMTEITGGDVELIRFHQVSLGACLSGAVEGHWLLFWYGVPRAGKNTLGELTEGVMGDYARTIPTSTLMSKKFESHPTEMANLQGIRLATSSELSDGDHWNEARIKQLTGDATISARYIGGNFFEFDRTCKLLVYGNYKPQLRSADEALRARLKIVPFKYSFLGKEDVDLPGRLLASQGYVLQWLIEGHRQWLEAGKKLPQCAAVEAEIAEYFEGQSTPKLWIRECCEVMTNDTRPDLQLQPVIEFYRDYKRWKEDRGESPLSQTRWEPEALSGFQIVKTRKGKCVRRLKLLPCNLPFPLASELPQLTSELLPPPAAPAPPSRVETFAAFVARTNAQDVPN